MDGLVSQCGPKCINHAFNVIHGEKPCVFCIQRGKGKKAQESTLEDSFDGFKEKRSHFRAWNFDCALKPGDSNNRCEFNQEGDSSRDLGGEIQHLLVCVLTLGNEEQV